MRFHQVDAGEVVPSLIGMRRARSSREGEGPRDREVETERERKELVGKPDAMVDKEEDKVVGTGLEATRARGMSTGSAVMAATD